MCVSVCVRADTIDADVEAERMALRRASGRESGVAKKIKVEDEDEDEDEDDDDIALALAVAEASK